MAFDYDKFDAAQIKTITKKIPVPELKQFFEEDDKPEWEIRGLTGQELAIVNESVATVSKTKAIIDAISSESDSSLKKGVETFLNKNEDLSPEDLVRRHKMLEIASIPPCPEHICVKIAHAKPTTFYKLTNKIIQLTGEGADLGE